MSKINDERLVIFNNKNNDTSTTIYVEVNSNNYDYYDMYIYNDKDKNNRINCKTF